MNPIELSLRVTVDESNIRAIVNVIRQALRVDTQLRRLCDVAANYDPGP